MAQGHRLIILSFISIVLLIVVSKCNSLYLFQDVEIPQRPTKFHSQNDIDRHANRMKQYQETMDQLRHWRRYIDQSNEDYDDILQNIFRQDKTFDDER